MKTYLIECTEIHHATYTIQAESEAEARAAFYESTGAETLLDRSLCETQDVRCYESEATK